MWENLQAHYVLYFFAASGSMWWVKTLVVQALDHYYEIRRKVREERQRLADMPTVKI